MRFLFAPIGIISGLLAGAVARKLFRIAWNVADDKEAPAPSQRDVSWAKLAVALLVQGAIFSLVKGVVNRGTRVGFQKATGTWPGDRREIKA